MRAAALALATTAVPALALAAGLTATLTTALAGPASAASTKPQPSNQPSTRASDPSPDPSPDQTFDPPAASPAATPSGQGTWRPAWSWRAGVPALPEGCTALSGAAGANRRWSPTLVTPTTMGVKLEAAPPVRRDAAGAGMACTGHATRYGRLSVHVRIPRAAGLVARVAFTPDDSSGSDWSGLSIPTGLAGPAYATNGVGGRVDGASVPGGLAGRFHTCVVTWTPTGTTVSVDGSVVYRGEGSYPDARWPHISLAPTPDGTPSRAYLLVDALSLETFTPDAGSSGSPSAGPAAGVPAPTATTPDRSATADGPMAVPAAPDSGPMTLVGPLDRSTLDRGWAVGGACAALAVVIGVFRAALLARRRTAPH